MTNTWTLITDERAVNLTETAAAIGRTTTIIAVAPSAPVVGGVDTIIHVSTAENVPAEVYVGVVVGLLADAKDDAILAVDRPAECPFTEAATAVLTLSVIVGMANISAEGAKVTRYGGLTNETVAFKGAMLTPEGGAAPEAGDPVVQTREGAPMGAAVVNVQPAGPSPTNLATVHRIVSCGRGLKTEEDLSLARTLAKALGTKIACLHPPAEGTIWLSKDRYVGVLGMHVAPDVYAAFGISGQTQHTPGMVDPGIVVAVNSDANAPTFRTPDYDIAGDIYDVVSAFTAALS